MENVIGHFKNILLDRFSELVAKESQGEKLSDSEKQLLCDLRKNRVRLITSPEYNQRTDRLNLGHGHR